MSLTFRSVLFSALLMGSLLASSCEQQKPAAATAPAAARPEAAPALEARYECPMGCAGSQGTKPGKCPVCKMKLEKKS